MDPGVSYLGPRTQNRVLVPKYYSMHGIWGPKTRFFESLDP